MSRIQAFDFSVDLLIALLWQYNSAEKLQALLESKQEWYDENQEAFWTNWLTDVFDLRTANEFGLSVWAIILEIPLSVILPPSNPDKPTWGFGQYRKNFGNGNFSSSSSTDVSLTMAQKRLVLQLRYFQLVSRGTVPEINTFLKELFKDQGLVYVLDGLNMNADYVFTFAPNSQLNFVLNQFDLLPRPAAVGVEVVVTSENSFGFGEFRLNFNNGQFN